MDARRFLSVQEFALLCGLSHATIRRYLKSGRLPFYQPAGPRSRVLIPVDALDIPNQTEPLPITAPLPRDGESIFIEDRHLASKSQLSGPGPQWMRR